MRWGSVQKFEGHPVVYSALHSHGSYKDIRGETTDKTPYQEAAKYEFSKWLRVLVNSMPGSGNPFYSFNSIVLADVTADRIQDEVGPRWIPWKRGMGIVLLDKQGWLNYSGVWSPKRHNSDHIHDPSPHLPGHLHMKLSQAAKLAKFINKLPKRVNWGGRPSTPANQAWWTNEPALPK